MTTEQATPAVSFEDIVELFRERGLEADATAVRVERIVNEILAGERTMEDVARSLDRFATTEGEDGGGDITTERIAELFRERGLEADATPERLDRILNEILTGQRTFEDVGRSLDRFATVPQGTGTGEDSVIPTGGRLVQILNPEGSDAESLYQVVYTFNGVEYSYEIGDQERFDELFGATGIGGFAQYSKVDQSEWDESGIFIVGSIDERLGATESEASLMQREMRALGFEQLPAWWDDEVTTIHLLGTSENWSASRLAKAISDTDAFKERFAGLDKFMAGRGLTEIISATTAYVQTENDLRASLRRYRGPNTDTSQEYLGRLIATGWTAAEAEPLIQAERTLRESPGAIDELNAILAFQGLELVDEDGFIEAMSGAAPPEVYEAINDTLRRQALEEAGVDIDTAFAASLGTGVSEGVARQQDFTQAAQQTAAAIARNASALDLQRFGLERDDIVAAMFGEESPTGKTAGEINEILGQLSREAQASAGGFAGTSSFLDPRGRIRIQGFSAT